MDAHHVLSSDLVLPPPPRHFRASPAFRDPAHVCDGVPDHRHRHDTTSCFHFLSRWDPSTSPSFPFSPSNGPFSSLSNHPGSSLVYPASHPRTVHGPRRSSVHDPGIRSVRAPIDRNHGHSCPFIRGGGARQLRAAFDRNRHVKGIRNASRRINTRGWKGT